MDYEECWKRKMIVRIDPDPELVERTLRMAGDDLEEGSASYREGKYAWALVQIYTSMLNFGRALMFSEGMRERSHICTLEYLKTYHGDEYGPLLNAFDSLRRERHSTLYDSRESISEEMVERAIGWCMDFKTITLRIIQNWDR